MYQNLVIIYKIYSVTQQKCEQVWGYRIWIENFRIRPHYRTCIVLMGQSRSHDFFPFRWEKKYLFSSRKGRKSRKQGWEYRHCVKYHWIRTGKCSVFVRSPNRTGLLIVLSFFLFFLGGADSPPPPPPCITFDWV